MVGDSPTLVARQLNAVANLEIIDGVLTAANRMKLDTDRDLGNARTTIAEAREELAKMPDFVQFEKDLHLAEELSKKIEDTKKRGETIFTLGSSLNTMGVSLRALVPASTIAKDEARVKALGESSAALASIHARLSSLCRVEREVGTVEGLLKQLKTPPQREILASIRELVAALDTTTRRLSRMERAYINLFQANTALRTVEASVNSLVREREKLAPEKCPTCGTPWSKK